MELNKIKQRAIFLHSNQKYGIYPYEIHLFNVVNVLARYILPNKDNFNLFAGAWLHDVMEDTSISKQKFIESFGEKLFKIVWCLTDGENGDYNQRKEEMYKKLINNQDSIIIKLADRIANVEFSLINSDEKKLNKYIEQNEHLNEILYNKVETELGVELLSKLNKLIASIKT
jgi:(p)ppGpp synthase/HD superfamily hydrolase